MALSAQIITTSFRQAIQELRSNRLRTFLSLLGITIGIFCIIAVLTILDSMEGNIRKSVASLGSDVLYVNRKPWMREGGEFKWWEYLQRHPMSLTEMRAVQQVNGVRFTSMCYGKGNLTLKHNDAELKGVGGYAVTTNFDRLQNIDIQTGRYLSVAELDGGANSIVIGHNVYEELFGTKEAVGKDLQLFGRSFHIVGVLKKSGKNMAGFDFDEAVIFSYNTANAILDTHSLDWNNDPMIMVKASAGVRLDDLKDEITGVLRTIRRVRPGEKNNFSINQLSQVTAGLTQVFSVIDIVGLVIGGFSLIVGAFGIANIMFVTVKERTKIIGLKKAIGARRSVILIEFLIEALTLCLMGGLIGIILVFLLSLLMTYGADFEVTLTVKNFIIGLVTSAFVGVLAGMIPAFRASRLDPVVAIRST